MEKLKINPEYEKLLPVLPTNEYEALKESIKTEGQHFPIIVNSNLEILDGHHRYWICLTLGLEPKYEMRQFSDILHEKKFVIESNLRRRHLNDFQRALLGKPLLEIEKQIAKQRQGQRTDLVEPNGTLPSNDGKDDRHEKESVAVVANHVGLSPTTFQRSLVIMEKAPEKLKKSVENGKTSINYAYNSIKRMEKHEETPILPEGSFDIIYADPPWEYEVPLRGDPECHYQTMTTQEICNLRIPSAKDAILFLWATNPKLEDALKVVKAWGFKYKTNLVWVKDKIGTGYYFRGQHELLLVAKCGDIPVPTEENRPASVLIAPRKEHSQKPEAIYDTIEKMYPNRKYLELFARSERNGWVSWGL